MAIGYTPEGHNQWSTGMGVIRSDAIGIEVISYNVLENLFPEATKPIKNNDR